MSQLLSIVVHAGGFDRVHYALVMAAAAAAIDRKVTLFFTGRAIPALLPDDGWHRLDPADDGRSPVERDAFFTSSGLAGFEELLEACVALGVTIMICEMGVRALGLAADTRLRDDVPVTPGGMVTFLNEGQPGGATVFI
ncbi:MAG TPA: DsrE family protein [Azospirillaceae bacterium]|nr:DsrE family protein [Azospirillaceae bacterium]